MLASLLSPCSPALATYAANELEQVQLVYQQQGPAAPAVTAKKESLFW